MESILRCAACHLSLPHGHYSQDDAIYCDRCWSCPDCARPSEGGGRCSDCKAAVLETRHVLPLVVSFLAELGVRVRAPVHLSSQAGGLLAAADMAHELVQLWVAENCLPETALTDGLARWAQRRLLLALGYHQLANRLLLDDNPFRGGGLHLCLQLEKQVGPRQLAARLAEAS